MLLGPQLRLLGSLRFPLASSKRTWPKAHGKRSHGLGECMCKRVPSIAVCPVVHLDIVARVFVSSRTTIVEFLREAVGVVGRELREELALNSSELRLSEA